MRFFTYLILLSSLNYFITIDVIFASNFCQNLSMYHTQNYENCYVLFYCYPTGGSGTHAYGGYCETTFYYFSGQSSTIELNIEFYEGYVIGITGIEECDSARIKIYFPNYCFLDTLVTDLPFDEELGFDPLPAIISGDIVLVGGNGDVTDVIIRINSSVTHPDSSGFYRHEIDLVGIITPTYIDINASLEGYSDSSITNIEVIENQIIPDVDFTLYYLTGLANIQSDIFISNPSPNPFREYTIIDIYNNSPQRIKVSVTDINNSVEQYIIDKIYNTGFHKVRIDAYNLNPGVYIYRIESKSLIETGKLVII